jgi:anaphase-promoting complex subunit 11
MKIKVKSYNAVASWRWNIKPKGKNDGKGDNELDKSKADLSDLDAEVNDDDDDDEEEDVCGICRVAFEGTCPNCKIPGDDCPLSELHTYTWAMGNY